MRIIKCDRCGATIPNVSDNVGYIAINLRDVDTDELVDSNPFEHWDICEDCLKAIHVFITQPKADKEKKFEEILESADAGKKKKPYPGSGPTIDVKKAQALRDAGWSVKKIAAELKTSMPTVRKWTHEPEETKKVRPHEWAEHEPMLGKDAVPRKEEDDEQMD